MKFSDVIKDQKAGEAKGITSVCSANKYVIEAAVINAKKKGDEILIEATSNQVDQYGGYTGMTPIKFKDYIFNIADELGFPREKIILGGDHLGPNVWQNEKSSCAMEKAKEQIRSYINAGFKKIHLDTSFPLADDKLNNKRISPKIITERAAQLCEVAERAYEEKKGHKNGPPVYVIGTDVPVPGGAQVEENELHITTANELEETIDLTKKSFYSRGLKEAWKRVIAVVVQPGVEFSDSMIREYKPDKTMELKLKSESFDNIILEAHSTDYQNSKSLRRMVKDHFGILKVGPWLTFALREAVFALEQIEKEWLSWKKGIQMSNMFQVIKQRMYDNPKFWKNHYSGSKEEIEFSQVFSYSDRVRYYWTDREINNSLNRLINNLTKYPAPLSLVSQFLPDQYESIRKGKLINKPVSMIHHKIIDVLKIYNYATSGV